MNLLKQLALSLFGILPAHYSGITHIEGDTYAVVHDKDTTDGYFFLRLQFDSLSGQLRQATLQEPIGMRQRRLSASGIVRDCEGIAFFPPLGTLFISGEEDQRIMEYTLEGLPTGRQLHIPSSQHRDSIRPNLGFEALCYQASTKTFWTITESTLPKDGPSASLAHREVRNTLRLTSFGVNLRLQGQYAYRMDAPTIRHRSGTYVIGVPSLCVLPDERLLVMEREAYVSPYKLRSFCHIKLYAVSPNIASLVKEHEPLSSLPDTCFLPKTLIAEFTTRLHPMRYDLANYEGMCLGPILKDGRQTLILISDSQGGMGNRLFHLKDYIKVIIL